MKKILFLFVALATFVACSNDDQEPYENIQADMADIHVMGKYIKGITTDAGVSLNVDPSMTVGEAMARPDTTYRVMLYYSQEEGQTCKLYRIDNVLVMIPCDSSKVAVKKEDPIYFTSGWVAKNRKYLNLNIGVKTGVSNTLQKFDASADDVSIEDGKRKAHITIKHDQNSQPEYYTQSAYISIPIAGFNVGDAICVKMNTYSGVIEKTFTIE